MTAGNIKGLNSIMTFVNAPNAQKTNKDMMSSMNFGDVMTKAESKNSNEMSNGSLNAQNSKTNKTDPKEQLGMKKQIGKAEEKANSINPNEKVNESATNEDTVTEISEEAKDILTKAGEEVIKKIADKLEVPMEDVLSAMEVLGLSTISLLEPSNLNELVLEVSGESDPMSLVTNEELFNTLNDLTAMVDATLVDMAEDMDIEVSMVEEMVDMALANEDMEMSVDANSGEDTIKEPTPKFTVTVERNGEVSKLETDEKGNAIKSLTTEYVNTKEVTDEKVSDQPKKEASHNEDANAQDGSREQGISFKNPILDNQINNINEMSSENVEASYLSHETTEIMDQIMDHMKINLSEDVNELEMQLHPASLGNVKINLVSKGGEVTAEFKVQNEMVKAAIENSLNELRENFSNQGTKVTAIEVSVEMQSFDSNLWKGKEENQQNPSKEQKRPRRINLNDIDALFEDEASEEELLAAQMLEATGGTVDYTA